MAKTVLIADDDDTLAKALAIRCKELGVEAVTSPDGLHAYGAILQNPPDLLILDVNMPGVGGLYMCEELSRDGRFEPIPIIVLTGDANPETVQRCKRLGAHYAWKGLNMWGDLKPMICQLLGLAAEPQAKPATPTDDNAQQRTKPRVLAVDDDPDVSRAIKLRLAPFGVEVVQAFTGMQGFWTALKERPDVIVMDFHMPDGYGNYLIGKLKTHTLTKDTPVIVLTGQNFSGKKDFALEREFMGLGADAYLTKPLDFDALLNELRRHIPIRERRPFPTLPASRNKRRSLDVALTERNTGHETG